MTEEALAPILLGVMYWPVDFGLVVLRASACVDLFCELDGAQG